MLTASAKRPVYSTRGPKSIPPLLSRHSLRCYPYFKETSALDLKEAASAWLPLLGSPLGDQIPLFSKSLFHRIACQRRKIPGQELGHLSWKHESVCFLAE